MDFMQRSGYYPPLYATNGLPPPIPPQYLQHPPAHFAGATPLNNLYATPQVTPNRILAPLPYEEEDEEEDEEDYSDEDSDYSADFPDPPPAWAGRGRSATRPVAPSVLMQSRSQSQNRRNSLFANMAYPPPNTDPIHTYHGNPHHNQSIPGPSTPYHQAHLDLATGRPMFAPPHAYTGLPPRETTLGLAPHGFPLGYPVVQEQPPPSVAQPVVIPLMKAAKWKQKQSLVPPHLLPNPKWQKKAAKQAIIDPSTAKKRVLQSVEWHPLLAVDSCRSFLYYDALRPPWIMIAGKEISVSDYYDEFATSPPMSSMILMMHMGDPLFISSSRGLRVRDVLSAIAKTATLKMRSAYWNRQSEGWRDVVSANFHRNRDAGLSLPQQYGVLLSDLLGQYTVFSGLRRRTATPEGDGCLPGTFEVIWSKQ